jgi:hypothetical protein
MFSKVDKSLSFADFGKKGQTIDSKFCVDENSSPKKFDFKSAFAYAANTTSFAKQGSVNPISVIFFRRQTFLF